MDFSDGLLLLIALHTTKQAQLVLVLMLETVKSMKTLCGSSFAENLAYCQ
jgi:hypothetical protein